MPMSSRTAASIPICVSMRENPKIVTRSRQAASSGRADDSTRSNQSPLAPFALLRRAHAAGRLVESPFG